MTKLPTSNGISKARPAEVLAKSGVKSGRAGDALPEDVANAVVGAGGKFATTAQLIKAAAEGRGKPAVKDEADEATAHQSDDGEQSYANAPVAMADAGVMQVAAMYAAATAQADAGQSEASDNDGVSTPLIIGGVLLAGGAIALAAGGGGGGGQANRAPTFSSGTTASVAENATASTVVYDANATDPDSANTLTYSLSGTDAAAFNINATTGEVTLKASANFEVKASYAITVVATDNGSPVQSASQNIAVTVTNVNEVPTITSAATASVAENAGIATVVYDAEATDPDAGTTLAYSLTGVDAGAFDINATTGEVTLKTSANFEAKSSYAITVVAADNGNPALTTSKDVVVSVTNVNEVPTITSGAAASVVDNAAAGSVVYTTVATDPDAGDSLVYELSGPDAGLFNISSTGVVTLKQAANYEASADHSYSFSVTAIDAGELSATQAVTVTIANAVDILSLDQGSFGDTFELDAANGNDPVNVLDVDFRLDETPAESDVEIVNFGANDYINFLAADPDDYSYQADGTDLVLTYLPAGGDLSTITLVDVLNPGAVVNDAASADAALDAALGAGDYLVGTALEATIDLDIAAGAQNAAGKSVTFTDDGSVESAAVIQNFRSDDVIAFTNAGDGGDVLYQATFDDPNDLEINYIDASGNLSSVVLDNVLNGDIVFDFDSASAALGRADFITFA